MSRTVEPHDAAVETALIGACLLSRTAIDDALATITASDFHNPANAHIFHAITQLHDVGDTVDQITVAVQLKAAGFTDEPYTLAALWQYTLDTPSISSAPRFARILADHALSRRIIHAAIEIAALGWGETSTHDPADALDRARTVLTNIEQPARIGEPDPDAQEFINATPTGYDWLLPDFLERGDRMLVTSGEGLGKSTLLAQLAVQAAAGIHPWTHRWCDPINVLIIDLENPARLTTRRLISLLPKATNIDPARLRIHVRPGGIDLTTRTDRLWLYDRVAANRADLLVIGPAYRMQAGASARGDIGGEDQTRIVTSALDDVRVRLGCAMVMETHAPHGHLGGRDLRPFGSSVWLRWPEFGIGLARDSDNPRRFLLNHWRGPRDKRTWPTALTRGGHWPWTPEMPTGTFRDPNGESNALAF